MKTIYINYKDGHTATIDIDEVESIEFKGQLTPIAEQVFDAVSEAYQTPEDAEVKTDVQEAVTEEETVNEPIADEVPEPVVVESLQEPVVNDPVSGEVDETEESPVEEGEVALDGESVLEHIVASVTAEEPADEVPVDEQPVDETPVAEQPVEEQSAEVSEQSVTEKKDSEEEKEPPSTEFIQV